MPDRDSVINDLNVAKRILCNPQMLAPEMCIRIGQAITSALTLLKEQEEQSVLSNRVCEAEPWRYVRKGFCPKCHQELEWLFNRNHCGFCGKELKWG